MPITLPPGHLEPPTPYIDGGTVEQLIAANTYSAAISAKRQADALEAIAASLATIAQHLAPVAVKPDPDGWIEWHGGKCPVPGDTLVEYRMRKDKSVDTAPANCLRWAHIPTLAPNDIVAYRLAPAR